MAHDPNNFHLQSAYLPNALADLILTLASLKNETFSRTIALLVIEALSKRKDKATASPKAEAMMSYLYENHNDTDFMRKAIGDKNAKNSRGTAD